VVAVVCLTVVAAAGPVGFAGTARAATLVVDDDGVECPAAGHATIQSAVDAASEGDTVEVCAGTYNETVAVDVEDLTLVADGAVLLDASATRGTAIRVEADDVWIEGFEIRNYTSNVIAIPDAEPSEGYHRTTITDNVVWISGPGAGANTAGIVFQEAKSNNITVTNNEIIDAPGGPDIARGIDVQSKLRFSLVNENARIENNTITARDAGILLGG
jgi:nitrous oxidase accessory protein NosD